MIEKDPKKILAYNMRKIRTEIGLSQEELAARSNLHRTYISSVERAQRNISLESLYTIAHALGCDPRDLIGPINLKEKK